MFNLLRQFWRDVHGATALEYSLIAGGISLVIAAAVVALGDELDIVYQDIGKMLGNL
jgi:Flp pilus assembly pilin Flp